MTMYNLRTVRTFFSTREKDIDALAGLTYGNLLALAPNVASLVQVDAQGQCRLLAQMFRKVLELTRASHLWPASAQTGNVLIPNLANLRARHAAAGVKPEHFAILKQALLHALERAYPVDFTAEVRNAVTFVFDALAKSLNEKRDIEETDPLQKFARVELGGEAARASFGQFLSVPAE